MPKEGANTQATTSYRVVVTWRDERGRHWAKPVDAGTDRRDAFGAFHIACHDRYPAAVDLKIELLEYHREVSPAVIESWTPTHGLGSNQPVLSPAEKIRRLNEMLPQTAKKLP